MISIIIPTYQEEAYLKDTLDHLVRGLQETDHEIIVSDSRSPDRTCDIARSFGGKVRLVLMPEGKKRGISQGKNDGAAAARGEFLAFIDADVTVPHPDVFFAALLAEFARKPGLLAITVPMHILRDRETFADRFFLGLLNLVYRIENNLLHSGDASGEFQFIRADAFRKLKGYREDLAAGEDNDMFRRLARAGRTEIYIHECIYHTGRRIRKVGWARLWKTWILNGLSVKFRDKSIVEEWETIR